MMTNILASVLGDGLGGPTLNHIYEASLEANYIQQQLDFQGKVALQAIYAIAAIKDESADDVLRYLAAKIDKLVVA